MKNLMNSALKLRQKGFVSILALMFLSSVVVFILAKSQSLSSSKSLETQQNFDSVAALALAESGREAAFAEMTNVANLDASNFKTNCSSYPNRSVVSLGRGSFQYGTPSSTATDTSCRIRVTGRVGSAQRTLESRVDLNAVSGIAGSGTKVSLSLTNPNSESAIAVFNLAWRRLQSSDSSGSNATASACKDCGVRWNQVGNTGSNAVGSLGTSRTLKAKETVTVEQTISANRNYVEVGLILGGFSGAPTLVGSYTDKTGPTNSQNKTVTYGSTTSGQADNWCKEGDTLVFGASGRTDQTSFTAQFKAMEFITPRNDASDQTVPMIRAAHFPNADGASSGALGDIFSEIWYFQNPYIYITSASASDKSKTLKVNKTTGLKPGTLLKVYASSGDPAVSYTHLTLPTK
jgi:hypothetical protein